MSTQLSTHIQSIEIARLNAAVNANIDDARVWRWYSDLMEDDRVRCERTRRGWQITIDDCHTVEDESFDCAVRLAAQTWGDIARAPVKLRRRRKTAVRPGGTALPHFW